MDKSKIFKGVAVVVAVSGGYLAYVTAKALCKKAKAKLDEQGGLGCVVSYKVANLLTDAADKAAAWNERERTNRENRAVPFEGIDWESFDDDMEYIDEEGFAAVQAGYDEVNDWAKGHGYDEEDTKAFEAQEAYEQGCPMQGMPTVNTFKRNMCDLISRKPAYAEGEAMPPQGENKGYKKKKNKGKGKNKANQSLRDSISAAPNQSGAVGGISPLPPMPDVYWDEEDEDNDCFSDLSILEGKEDTDAIDVHSKASEEEVQELLNDVAEGAEVIDLPLAEDIDDNVGL